MPSIKKLSFSITTLLLVTALVASILSNYMLRKENESLRIENRNMANELLAQYELADPTQLHWSQIELPSKMMWRFRVYVPRGEKMQLNYAIGPFTEEFPAPMRSFDEIIEGSDQLQTVTVQIRQMNATTVKIDAFKNGAFAHGCFSMAPKQFAWLDQLEELSDTFTRDPAAGWPNLSNPQENVILLQKIEPSLQGARIGGTRKIANPPNKFMIWLEPVK